MQQPQIIEKAALTIVGLETPFIHALSPDTNNFKVIPPLWEQFLDRAAEVPGRSDPSTSYGIIYSRPESERSHPHELQYIAGVEVELPAEPPPWDGAANHSGGNFRRVFAPRPDPEDRRNLPRNLPPVAAAISVETRRNRGCRSLRREV